MEALVDILICAVTIWIAVMIGLLIGWSWRPSWAGLVSLGFRSKCRFIWAAASHCPGVRRFWVAITALLAFPFRRRLWFGFCGRIGKLENFSAPAAAQQLDAIDDPRGVDVKPVAGACDGMNSVTEKDLEHLLLLFDRKDGEMEWQNIMERSTCNLTYQAWYHEPEIGPIVLRSKTVFEDATPDLVRDFFWDDEFRLKWDPMLAYVRILEECRRTGLMIVHWIKKFPFFRSDREYIISKRMWEAGNTYYCLTKGVPYPTLPRRSKPRHVDLYFSSWIIKPAKSRKGDGQLSACEVLLIHYEDMGIRKDVAKLGVRHGMWGTVKKLHAGFRTYQMARKSEASLTRCALMARITTKIPFKEETDYENQASGDGRETGDIVDRQGIKKDGIDWKWLAIGGAVALVCGLQTGLIAAPRSRRNPR